jgi:glycosyltransferase involved in cell wall biosynthesis
MKILYIIESLKSGGKERRLLELIDGLKKDKNFTCAIIILNDQIHYKKAHQNGCEIFTIKKDNYFSISMQIFNICKTFRPTIIHSWAANTTVYSLFAIKIFRSKLIDSSISTAPLEVKKKSKINLINQIIFKFADMINANSQAGLNSYYAPPNKSAFIHNGFNFDRIKNIDSAAEIRKKFSVTTEKVTAMVASFSEKKDYATYIKAALQILENNNDVTFLCIGAGNASKYQTFVPLKYAEKIKFLGKQNDVEFIMNICDFTVLSTYTEGISNSIMESMALGIPVIATDGGGTPEIIIDGENGILIPPKSPQILAEKMTDLLNNSEKVEYLGKNAIRQIKENFSIDKMIDEFILLYKQVLAK